MDCPSEENLIRMKLVGISNIKNLDFDIPNRKLTVFHSGGIAIIEKLINELVNNDNNFIIVNSIICPINRTSNGNRYF